MLVDTGANVTLLRTVIAQKLNQQFICTSSNIFLKTATGEKAIILGKLDASNECGSRRFQHKVYVADITDPCILGLNFLRELNLTVDLERNEIRTGGEDIPLFSANIEFPKYAVPNSPSQISEKGVLVTATLVDLKKETVPVRILNMDNKPKTMEKGAIIASYEPVVDILARPQEFSGEQPIQSILENLEGLNEDQRYKNCSKNFGTCFPHVTLMSAIVM
ncbi:uncharacterized protein NPIL_589481 [Nephila pilipes]|uniref:Peptidase A2 domain-containing protein n=1 Tax=Nephila pilipes TaxID=299642 RepID=A0A8X6P8E4_NEPPI|nr:uncharacterized protein NPIL_589481 [Nephila pilipes]